MKFFKLEMQITEDGQGQEVVTPLMSVPMDEEDAITDYHTSLGSLRASVDEGNLKAITCCVINSFGGVSKDYCEYYEGKSE